jgi:hypothetical protein
MCVLRPAARAQHQELGRGALVVDTTSQPLPDAGHPIFYLTQDALDALDEPDIQRMVHRYNPRREMVNRFTDIRSYHPGEVSDFLRTQIILSLPTW